MRETHHQTSSSDMNVLLRPLNELKASTHHHQLKNETNVDWEQRRISHTEEDWGTKGGFGHVIIVRWSVMVLLVGFGQSHGPLQDTSLDADPVQAPKPEPAPLRRNSRIGKPPERQCRMNIGKELLKVNFLPGKKIRHGI
ncbi:hypothetical protein V8G54_010963 [Vigna mungo]|uniref:Uncharacterized protein n=1 Tax=Vigna mungo TaxID=3915 RepID=A0AAQ3S0R4_VIGMU